jgi:hypothetical protein
VLAAGFGDVVHPAHVRMRDLPRQPNFLMETRQPGGVIRDLLRQEFQSAGQRCGSGRPASFRE